MLILPAYSFWNDLLTLAQQNKNWPIQEGRIIGGRFGGKTFSCGAFITKLCNSLRFDTDEFVKASAIIYRKSRKDRDDVWYQFNKFLSNTIQEQNVAISQTRYMWLYENGNEVRFDYTESKSKGKKYGKGKASISGDYIVIVLEEASEFEIQEITAILESVRGDNPNAQILLVCLANPENPRNWFIKNSENIMHFNPDIMSTLGVQSKIVEQRDELGIPKKMLIMYTNWRAIQNYEKLYLNNGGFRYLAKEPILVSQDKLDWLVKQYAIDKMNAMVADIGCPGSDFTAVFLRDMDKITPNEYFAQEYVGGGVDAGFGKVKGSGETAAIFLAYDLRGKVNIHNEYVWDNKFMFKNPAVQADEIVQFYINEIKNYTYMTAQDITYENPLYIRVDYSDKAFIQLLNDACVKYNVDYFGFIECKKEELWNRVTIFQYLLQRYRVGISPNCKKLLDQIASAQWDDTGAKPKLKGGNDHCLDAMFYALEDFLYNCISDEDKEYIYNKLTIRGKKKL